MRPSRKWPAVLFVLSTAIAATVMPARLSSQQSTVFRERVDFVSMAVTVADKRHRLISDLGANDFAVFEDGKPQTISAFAAGEQSGPQLHVGILLDVSASQELDLPFSQSASIKFLQSLDSAVDITFMDFATELRVGRYPRTDLPLLGDHIRRLTTGGYTTLYDAIGVYLDGASEQDGRKVMVLYTDGGDTRSSLSFSELMKLLKASDVTVYAIGELEHQPELVRNTQRALLQQIAESTGGAAFFPDRISDLDKAYDQIVGEVRSQYTLGYVSTNDSLDGAWRKVEIKITNTEAKNLRIRARKGYYAPLKHQASQ